MKLVEKFTSINGEGKRAGELAVFIRFPGCNLRCTYCDTMWANEGNVKTSKHEISEIIEYIHNSGANNVTITGGEPLLQKDLTPLLEEIQKSGKVIEIETNGSVELNSTIKNSPFVTFTMDYKMPSSGMEDKMCLENLSLLRPQDTLKMVCGSKEDLEKVLEIIPKINNQVTTYLSPVFGEIEAKDMVDFMMKHKLHNVKLQLQLHKYIWDPDMTGV